MLGTEVLVFEVLGSNSVNSSKYPLSGNRENNRGSG